MTAPVRLQRRARPRGLLPAGRDRHGQHRPVRRRAARSTGRSSTGPNKGVTNGISHFAVRAERDGTVIDARILNGPYLGNRTGDFPGRHVAQFRVRRAARLARGHAAFPSRTRSRAGFRSPSSIFDRRTLPGRRRAARLQPVHPARRPRLEHPGRDVRDHLRQPHRRRRSTTPPSGVVGHGLRPPTERRAAAPHGRTWARIVTDEHDAGRRPTTPSSSSPPTPPTRAGRRTCTAATGSMRSRSTGRISRVPGPFAERDYRTPGLCRRHGPQPRQQPRRGARDGRARASAGPCASRIGWYAPNFRKYWVIAGLALPPGVGGERPVEELVRDRVDRRRRDRRRGPGALGRPARARPSPSATRSTARRCPVPVARCRRGQSLHPQVADDAAARGRHVLRLGGLPPDSRLLRRQLHPRLELRAGAALPVPGAGALDARRPTTSYNQDEAGGMSFRLSLPLGHDELRPSGHAPTASSATS